jgi:hypothetical protein
MTHTFFENNSNYHLEETREVDQFTVEISFAPDDTQLDLLFDTDADYYPELIENLESGFWQHMIVRVQAKYDGKVMGDSYLGSIVAESPEKWLLEDTNGDGVINGMIDEAVDQARTEALRMLDVLKKDFLNTWTDFTVEAK